MKLAWDSTAVWLKDENAHSQSAELAAGTVLQYQLKRLVGEAVQLDVAHRRCFLRLHTVSSTEEHDGSIAATHAGLLPDTAGDVNEEGGKRIPARNGERKGNEKATWLG